MTPIQIGDPVFITNPTELQIRPHLKGVVGIVTNHIYPPQWADQVYVVFTAPGGSTNKCWIRTERVSVKVKYVDGFYYVREYNGTTSTIAQRSTWYAGRPQELHMWQVLGDDREYTDEDLTRRYIVGSLLEILEVVP